MSALIKMLGAIAGKLANIPGLISGVMSAMDPKVVAQAVNENGKFVSEMIGYLDPKALAAPINANPDFMTKLIGELDPAAIAESVNKNQRFVTKMVEGLKPDVFSRSMNVVFNKMRKTTFKPNFRQPESVKE